MAMKIKFDSAHVPEQPTLVLYSRSGKCYGQIEAYGIVAKSSFQDADEFTFSVNKYYNKHFNPIWDNITDFKLCYAVEWDTFFQITLDVNETTETVKRVSCVQLAQSELSQINLYNIQINTEDDIAREDYERPTVFYDDEHPESSLLHRIFEKAPHYLIKEVDESLMDIQRVFEFDNTSLHDALNEIAEEIDCLVVYNNGISDDGKILREVSFKDLETYCLFCGHRGNFDEKCPRCESPYIREGYGDDTTIFISSDELTDEVSFSTDSGAVKNCFRLEAGDDLMTATIRNCNPNGTSYLWYITDAMKEDMSDALVKRLEDYDDLYEFYDKTYTPSFNTEIINRYNTVATKYQQYNPDIELIDGNITGYSELMNAYYNTVDLTLYIQSVMMPSTIDPKTTTAREIVKKYTTDNLSPIAVSNVNYASKVTVDGLLTSMCRTYTPSGYHIEVNTSTLVDKVWVGSFNVSNYKDDEDYATSSTIYVRLTDEYEEQMEQKIRKTLNSELEDYSIVALFDMENPAFAQKLKEYSISRLVSFKNACQSCLDIMTEEGMGSRVLWENQSPNPYQDLYLPYYNKLRYLNEEIAIKTSDINQIIGTYHSDGRVRQAGLQTLIMDENAKIHKALDFEKYLGETLYQELCLYKREDTYTNENFISDGLNNAELFTMAREFINVARNELYKSAELQHSISTSSLNNLLVIPKFAPIVKYFQVGNWMRVLIDDKVYKLRLLNFEVDYDNLATIDVEFSDVKNTADSISTHQAIMAKATSIASTYDAIQRQAKKSRRSNTIIKEWFETGMDTTNVMIFGDVENQTQVWDEHGMLFREYNEETETYNPEQLKIINSTIAITDDDWETIKTAVGKFYYIDPETGDVKQAYGVNAETLVGKLIIGENMALYNENATLKFDKDGFVVHNDFNTITIDPSNDSLFTITNQAGNDVIYFDQTGNGNFNGSINSSSAHIGDDQHYIDFHDGHLIIKPSELDISASEELMDRLEGFDNAISSINKYGITYQVISTPKGLDWITVRAYVYRNGVDVTEEYPYYYFTWVKRSEEGEEQLGMGYEMDIPKTTFDFNGVIIGRFNLMDSNGILTSDEGGMNTLTGALTTGNE